jgi:hypothetical protein
VPNGITEAISVVALVDEHDVNGVAERFGKNLVSSRPPKPAPSTTTRVVMDQFSRGDASFSRQTRTWCISSTRMVGDLADH